MAEGTAVPRLLSGSMHDSERRVFDHTKQNSGEQRKMEETGCEVVCCVPTTVMVKVYVKVKVSRTLLFFQTAEELFCKSFLGSPITRKVWPTLLSLLFLIWLMTLLNSVCTVLPSIESLFYHSC